MTYEMLLGHKRKRFKLKTHRIIVKESEQFWRVGAIKGHEVLMEVKPFAEVRTPGEPNLLQEIWADKVKYTRAKKWEEENNK